MATMRYKGRIALLGLAILSAFVGIAVRLVDLHLHPASWVSEPIRKGRDFSQKLMGRRGRIVDCNGEILAMDLAAYHVYADPKYIAEYGDAELVCRCLSEAFRIPESEVREKLSDTSRQYVRIKKYVPGLKLTAFKRKAFGVTYAPSGGTSNVYLRGVGLEDAPIRNYPKGPLMAHVVGFVNREGAGSAGIEQRMDRWLRGEAGWLRGLRDGRHREIYTARKEKVEPKDGATVVLTLDQQLQYAAENAVEKMCREYHAKAGWAIVQRVATGEILAMASFPTYDLNRYAKAPAEWRRNRAISVNYEPGSVMKAGVIGAALDRGIVKEEDRVDCEKGYWVYGGKALRDSHGHDVITVADVIKYSSNIGTAKIALKMGPDLLYGSLKRYRFGERLGVGLPGEEGGILFSPKHWSKISITRIGMGQEVAATALQMLSMMDAIACNGVQMRPYVVKKVVDVDGTPVMENRPTELGRPISSSSARRMRRLLARVTEEGGTGTKARLEGYVVAGKTGTAQKVRPASEGGGYYSKRFVSSFAGFLPAENPEIGIIVVADDPGTYTDSGRKIKYYGGTVCGPTFREIAEFAVRYLRIPPQSRRVYVARPEL